MALPMQLRSCRKSKSVGLTTDRLDSLIHPKTAMSLEIILIGPIGAGKSSVAELLSSRLSLPQQSMDERRWDYYKEIGIACRQV
jgi:replication-associated recombination protein RarA